MTKKNKESQIYAGAAEYLFFQGKNLSDAIILAEFAIELDKNNGWARRLKIEVYEKLNYMRMLSEKLAKQPRMLNRESIRTRKKDKIH